MSPSRRYTFGDCTLDLERGALLKAGADVKLRPKSFEVLRLLVQRHGQLVTKDEMLNTVWKDVVVTDGAVGQCLIDVRRAIGDESQQVIRTVPRRGYILDVPVIEADGAVSHNNAPAPAVTPPIPRSVDRGRMLAAATVAVCLLVGGALSWWLRAPQTEAVASNGAGPTGATAAVPKSIAVLPFVNMSSDPEQEYFSDGISEEILNLLAQTPELQVIARTSSFSFKGSNANVAQIAGDLEVTHVLEGSVRKAGNRVRITAQLIDARNSSHLWSDTYDRTLDDILGVQSDIAESVAQALKVQLLGGSASPLPPKSAAAYELYLQGQFFFGRRGNGDLERAATYYREALAIDPDFARAWAGLAGVAWIQLNDGGAPPEQTIPELQAAAMKAVALDPNLSEGHFRLANYYWWNHEPDVARKHDERARELAPNSPLMLSTGAMKEASRGNLGEAITRYARVVALDPLAATHRRNLGQLLYTAGRFDEARIQFGKETEINPAAERGTIGCMLILEGRFEEALAWIEQSPPGVDRDYGMAMVQHALGRTADADAAVARLITEGPRTFFWIAEVAAVRGKTEEAFEWLRRSLLESPRLQPDGRVHWEVRFSPFLKPLHADPRWDELMRTLPVRHSTKAPQ